jgi:predicted alpha/beta superfamily hydrolase
MKKLLLITVIALSLLNCETKKTPEATVEKDTKIVFGHKEVIHSDILNEDREVWIHLPVSISDDTFKKTKYPILYLLDGPGHFYSVTGIIKRLSSSKIVPEMIIVAIRNTNRSRDLTPTHVDLDFFSGDSIRYASGGGNKFLDFMEKELIPHIDKTYPASTYKTFVGHSFGGLSVINALINRQHLFNNYVAIDPSLWWDNQAFLKVADSILSGNKFDGKSLYVGVANTMGEGMKIKDIRNDNTKSTAHIRSILKFVNSMDSQNNNGLHFGWKYYENDDHGSVPLITEYDALRFLFPWYRLKGINQFFDQNSTSTADDLLRLFDTHYKNVSYHFGYENIPPESFVNSLGYNFLRMPNKIDIANAMFSLNVKNYPNSSNVYDSMGDYHLAQQDSVKALELFTKALKIGPNDFSQKKIDTLKKKLKNE